MIGVFVIIVKGFIEVPADELALVKKELENHIKLTLEEPGCISFQVLENKSIPNRFDVLEEFHSEKDFDLHQQRVSSSDWGKISKNVKRHYQIFSR